MMELIIGGSGSGKSERAEQRICRARETILREREEESPLIYIATMFPFGEETKEKIRRHREMRSGKGFCTLEWYMDLKGHLDEKPCPLPEGACVLLECMSNLTANEMYMEGGAGADTVDAVCEGVRRLKERCAYLVVVTNDVFRESGEDSGEMALYKKNLGEIGQFLMGLADRAEEAVYGTFVTVKGEKVKMGKEQPETGGPRIVTGGAYQGKGTFARRIYPEVKWEDGNTVELDAVSTCGGIDDFHEFIRRWLLAGRSAKDLRERILADNRQIALISDEIGCGLVPVDGFERYYREEAGRVLTGLAEHASRVDRVICGTGMRLR